MSRRLWRLEVICLLSVSLLQAPATPAPTCEDDGVQLLHMRQAQAADLNNSHAGAGEDSSLHVDTMKASTSSTAGALPPHTNMTEAQIHPSLLQTWRAKLSASYNSAYRDGYGVLTIVAITLFACLTSCCAIVSTRAFLVNESCDARRADSVLGMHERRHRLLQSLQSLRPSAAPPHPPHLKPKTNYKPWRQLVIDSPLEGDRLGVNLTEDTLVITSFADPRAETFGFKVGDRIVHINGVPVFKQLDFLQVLSGAMRDFHRSKQPIVVTTVDPTSDPTGPTSSATSKDAPRGLELQDEVCGRWQLSSGENFIISKMPGVEQLMLTLLIGDTTAATGLIVPDGPDLRCQLYRLNNTEFGEAWLSFSTQSHKIEASLKPAGAAHFGKVLVASKLAGPSTQSTPLPCPRELSGGARSAASSWPASVTSLPPKKLSGEDIR